jgi:hypothetical protein
MWVVWNIILVRFKMELALVQDRLMVCIKCTKGLETILDATDGTPR